MTPEMNAIATAKSQPLHHPRVGDLHVSAGLSPNRVKAALDAMELGQKGPGYQAQPLSKKIMVKMATQAHAEDWKVAGYVSEAGVGKINGNGLIDVKQLETQHSVKQGKPTDQKSSGRCWIFSGLNVMRPAALEEYGDDFEYSQNFVAFWDKVERANFFLEKMIEMKDEEPSELRLMNLLEHCFRDGGEWELFRNVVEKYGVVPKSAMRETSFSGSSGGYMSSLQKYLREQGAILHTMARANMSVAAMQEFKDKLISEVVGTLTKYLGCPPEKFIWKNKDGSFEQITPTEFYARSPVKLTDMVHLTHLPYHDEGTKVEVKDVGNVVEGDPMCGLNVSMDVMKAAIRNSIKSNRSVLFASEVAELDRKSKVFAMDVDRSREILGQEGMEGLQKGAKLLYQATSVAHGMAIIGCDDLGHARIKDPVEGTPEVYTQELWKIENSWKDMDVLFASDSWMDNYLYGVVIHKDDLPKVVRKLWDDQFTPKTYVPAYDPFGRI